MKIKLYIVTYRNPIALAVNLRTLFDVARADVFDLNVFIINNYGYLDLHYGYLDPQAFHGRVSILNNMLRPDFSTGHLSRNWNQAIINGFENPNHPDCDLLLTCQDDTTWHANSFHYLFDALDKFDFITDGHGDNFCAYKIEAVRAIGLWDERFCNIGYQEADYFLRAVIYHGQRSSINDKWHGRVWQPLPHSIIHRPDNRSAEEIKSHFESQNFHQISKAVFLEKWGCKPDQWTPAIFKARPKIRNFMLYPYFEIHLPGLRDQNYCVPQWPTL